MGLINYEITFLIDTDASQKKSYVGRSINQNAIKIIALSCTKGTLKRL